MAKRDAEKDDNVVEYEHRVKGRVSWATWRVHQRGFQVRRFKYLENVPSDEIMMLNRMWFLESKNTFVFIFSKRVR